MSTIERTSSTGYPEVSQPKVPNKPLTPVQNYFTSFAGMSTAVMCFHPLVTIKNRLQMAATETKNAQPFEKPLKSRKPKWVQGVAGLYKGVGVNLLNAPIFALMGTVNGLVNDKLLNQEGLELNESNKLKLGLLSGLGSGFVGAVPTTTLDLLVLQTQLQNKPGMPKKSPRVIIHEMLAAQGMKAAFRGFVPTCAREMPGALSMLFLGPLADQKIQSLLPDWLGPLKPLLSVTGSGLMVGSFTAVLTHPADVVKSTMQKDWSAAMYPRIVDAAKAVYQQGGARAFYTGVTPRLGCLVVATGAIVTVQKKMETLFQQMDKV